ncbi:MAG TPA: folate-binding protein [Solirubrobacteraceae bacterium]|nr:folate-binding protein [Solirubrobacteraceae bacterium]
MTATTTIHHPDAGEHRALQEAVGLFDRSARGKLALSGDEAPEFLDSLLSNDVKGLDAGSGCYATLLTHRGRLLADVRVLRTAEGVWLDTERPGLQALFDALTQFRIGYRAELHKQTLQRGLLSLIGPEADRLVPAPPAADEHAHVTEEIAGIDVLVVRTDVGLDLICPAEQADELRHVLVAAGAVAVGEATVECLRVERGRPRFGIDMDETTMPQEAAINERAVSYTKGCYVGQETVARLYWKGKPNRHLRGLRLSGDAAPGDTLRLGEREVGVLSSVALSPAHGPIGLALVRRAAAPGDVLAVGDGSVTAVVSELPFDGPPSPGDGPV